MILRKRDLQKRNIISGPANIMEILKNKLTKYYNNIQQIYCGVTWAAPPTLTGKEEEKDNRDVSRSRLVI